MVIECDCQCLIFDVTGELRRSMRDAASRVYSQREMPFVRLLCCFLGECAQQFEDEDDEDDAEAHGQNPEAELEVRQDQGPGHRRTSTSCGQRQRLHVLRQLQLVPRVPGPLVQQPRNRGPGDDRVQTPRRRLPGHGVGDVGGLQQTLPGSVHGVRVAPLQESSVAVVVKKGGVALPHESQRVVELLVGLEDVEEPGLVAEGVVLEATHHLRVDVDGRGGGDHLLQRVQLPERPHGGDDAVQRRLEGAQHHPVQQQRRVGKLRERRRETGHRDAERPRDEGAVQRRPGSSSSL